MKQSLRFRIGFPLLVLIIIIPMIFPFLWMFMSAFKTQVDIISWPPKFLFSPTMVNFNKVFNEQNFLLYLKNSMIVGVGSVAISLLLGLPAAYSIARFHQKRLSVMILIARLMPGISFLMPW